MRLLVVTQNVDQGDSNLGFFHRWIEAFARRCETVIVICLEEGAHELPGNVRVRSLGKERGAGKLARLRALFGIIWQERRAYDAVFVHMNPIYVVLAGWLWRLLGKRVGLWYTHKSVTLKLRAATVLAHHIFTASEESFRINTPKKQVVGHGVAFDELPSRVASSDDGRLDLVTVGRISKVKNIEVLINAVKQLAEEGRDVRLTIVGDPRTAEDESYRTLLAQRAAESETEQLITFVGGVPHTEISRYLSRADLFVSASETGSLDKAILEAAAVGLPVITCNDAAREVFGVYADQLMFTPGRTDELIERIRAIGDNTRERRRYVGETLREHVRERHDLARLIGRIEAALSGSDDE